MQRPLKTIISATIITLMGHNTANAGAFSLYTESSAVAIGNYAAGVAAEGSDASIGWYNPAGLSLLHEQQAVFSGAGVFPSSALEGSSTYITALPGFNVFPPYSQSFSGLNGANSAFVPAFHYALPLGEQATFGLSVVSPFGLSSSYPLTSPVRYTATYTQLETIDVSPELGGKITNNFAVGLGLDLQYARVKFNRMIGSPVVMRFIPLPETTLDSLSYNKGDSLGFGFHAGILGMFNDNHTRVGLNYQSKVTHEFRGSSTLTGRLADPNLEIGDALAANPNAQFRSNDLFSNDVTLPEIVTLSGYQDITTKLALLGSVVYSGWNSFQTIQFNNVAAYSADLARQVLVNSTAIQNYRNAWRFAVGANYHVTEQWMMRFGGGFDQTPTVDSERDVRLPDTDRWALSIGTHYQMRPSLGFDLGYTHLFANSDVLINKTEVISPTSRNSIAARGNNSTDLVGLQATWTIDQIARAK